MMDTVLHPRAERVTVEGLAKPPNDPRSPWDSYRRLSRCMGPSCSASTIIASRKSSSTPSWKPMFIEDPRWTRAAIGDDVVEGYKTCEAGDRQAVPLDPQEQLWGASAPCSVRG